LTKKYRDISNINYISTLNRRVKVEQHISLKTHIFNVLNIR